MSLNDTLSAALSKLQNADKVGKPSCKVQKSKLIKAVLDLLYAQGYIGGVEFIEDGRGGQYEVALKGKIVKCGAIKPRFPMDVSEYEKFEKRYLLARDFGLMIVSTSEGLMLHTQAKQKHIGGKLIAYCY